MFKLLYKYKRFFLDRVASENRNLLFFWTQTLKYRLQINSIKSLSLFLCAFWHFCVCLFSLAIFLPKICCAPSVERSLLTAVVQLGTASSQPGVPVWNHLIRPGGDSGFGIASWAWPSLQLCDSFATWTRVERERDNSHVRFVSLGSAHFGGIFPNFQLWTILNLVWFRFQRGLPQLFM